MQISSPINTSTTQGVTAPDRTSVIAPGLQFINQHSEFLKAFGADLTLQTPFNVDAKFSSPLDAINAAAMFRNEINGANVAYLSYAPFPTPPATIDSVVQALKGAKSVGIAKAIAIPSVVDHSKPFDPNAPLGTLGILADITVVPTLKNLLKDSVLGYTVVVEPNQPVTTNPVEPR